jgi:flagellin-like protein
MILVWKRSSGSTDRGQSEVIGVVLLLSVTVIGVTVMGATGAAVLGDAQSDSRVAQTQNSMAQLSSKAGLVALGGSGGQQFDLGNTGDGTVKIDESAGNVTLIYDPNEGDPVKLDSFDYGTVVYKSDNTEIAYQGGGVWKKQNGGSVMISPPEYHYRGETLTFPIVRVVGNGAASGSVNGYLKQSTTGKRIYPNDTYANPLDNGTVYVKIQSEYYEGWYQFFDDRSDGEIQKYDGNNTVVVDLRVPVEEEVNTPIVVTDVDGLDTKGNGDIVGGEAKKGVLYPTANAQIEAEIEHCEMNPDECEDLESEDTLTNGTYYADSYEGGSLKFDTSEGDVNVVVNGDFEPNSLEISGDEHQVNVYLKGSFEKAKGNTRINTPGTAGDLVIYMHSDGEFDFDSGTMEISALLYAPNSHVDLTGNVDFHGGIVGNSVELKGSTHVLYDDSVEDADLTINNDPHVAYLTYLHVTENVVEVELD